MIHKTIKSILTVTLIIGLTILVGCDEKVEKPTPKPPGHVDIPQSSLTTNVKGALNSKGEASGPTMNTVFTSTELYSCPMCDYIVTDNPSAKCASCGMDLKKMPDSKFAELREPTSKGCPMCPVVVPGSSTVNKCPICKMDLVVISDNTALEHTGHVHP